MRLTYVNYRILIVRLWSLFHSHIVNPTVVCVPPLHFHNLIDRHYSVCKWIISCIKQTTTVQCINSRKENSGTANFETNEQKKRRTHSIELWKHTKEHGFFLACIQFHSNNFWFPYLAFSHSLHFVEQIERRKKVRTNKTFNGGQKKRERKRRRASKKM